MLDKVNNSAENTKNSYQNQNKMIDSQYQHQKYEKTFGKAVRQLQNTYNPSQNDFLKTKKDTNDN
jgi:hypothetical protein